MLLKLWQDKPHILKKKNLFHEENVQISRNKLFL